MFPIDILPFSAPFASSNTPPTWNLPISIFPEVIESKNVVSVPALKVSNLFAYIVPTPLIFVTLVADPIVIAPVTLSPIFIPAVWLSKKLNVDVGVNESIFELYNWAIDSDPWAYGNVKNIFFPVVAVK